MSAKLKTPNVMISRPLWTACCQHKDFILFIFYWPVNSELSLYVVEITTWNFFKLTDNKWFSMWYCTEHNRWCYHCPSLIFALCYLIEKVTLLGFKFPIFCLPLMITPYFLYWPLYHSRFSDKIYFFSLTDCRTG